MSVDEVRYMMLKAKCNGDIDASSLSSCTVDFSRFPPSIACLRHHIARANYQVRIWKTGNIAMTEAPDPWDGHGWLQNEEPFWCENKDVLPESLVDLLYKEYEDDSNSDEEESESDFQYCADSEA